jgi:xylulose-5-phosphate/fructose-6-phosphate phosphoketolase
MGNGDLRLSWLSRNDSQAEQPQSEHPHGLEDQDFDELFTTDKPYRRHNHDNIHVRGYKEEGTTTRPPSTWSS